MANGRYFLVMERKCMRKLCAEHWFSVPHEDRDESHNIWAGEWGLYGALINFTPSNIWNKSKDSRGTKFRWPWFTTVTNTLHSMCVCIRIRIWLWPQGDSKISSPSITVDGQHSALQDAQRPSPSPYLPTRYAHKWDIFHHPMFVMAWGPALGSPLCLSVPSNIEASSASFIEICMYMRELYWFFASPHTHILTQ